MFKFYGVSFKSDGKNYIFKSEDEYSKQDNVIVETEKGLQYGIINSMFAEDELKINLDDIKNVIRKATEDDLKQHQKNCRDAEAAILKAVDIANELDLSMRFIGSSFTFDRKQLLFNFLADDRVDFRELAKRLAGIYRTRIELHQVGARDKAREVGGIGHCGRKLCCETFLSHIDAVSMGMAKNQGIALNPTKINGSCGRLLCCLAYEDEEYTRCNRGLPSVGQYVDTEFGRGCVESVNILKRRYVVDINGEKKEVELRDCGKRKE